MFLRKDPMKRARPPEVSKGAEVFSADGRSLGVVSELDDVSFKVNASMAPDYWLGRDYVIESTPERVQMSFMKSELGAYRLGQPGMAVDTDTTQEALSDTAVPGDQKSSLVEGATPDNAEQLNKFGKALQDSALTPLGFTAENIMWSSNAPGSVTADVTVHSESPNLGGGFTFPMEFNRTLNGW